MKCPDCKTEIEEEDFDLQICKPMVHMVSVIARCSCCDWAGRAVLPVESFLTYDSGDPEISS